MTDSQLLTEIAANEREVSHPKLGSFLIKRPNHRTFAQIDSARSRAMNADMQTKVSIVDPETGKSTFAPAYFTRNHKKKVLEQFSEWSEKDEVDITEAEQAYRNACIALDSAGFESTKVVLDAYEVAYKEMVALLGPEKVEKLSAPLGSLFPETVLDNTIEGLKTLSGNYITARSTVEKAARSNDVSALLDRVDVLHKQYDLLLLGMETQTALFMLKLKEITLFADTIESRADKTAQLVKIIHCVLNPITRTPKWSTVDACEEESPELLGWLLNEVETFEKLEEPVAGEKDPNRFNFLLPLVATSE